LTRSARRQNDALYFQGNCARLRRNLSGESGNFSLEERTYQRL